MSSVISWNMNSESKTKQGSDEFLRVRPDCMLTVRLIGDPVQIVKIFTNQRQCIVIDSEDIGKQLQQKYPQLMSNISIRYACWCIDRSDNSLKILDMPISVARAFGNQELLGGKKISGKEQGYDWLIKTNGKKGKDVRYEAVVAGETSLTAEEIEMVQERKAEEGRYFDLTKIFKSCGFEEAEEKVLDSQ